MNMHKTPPIVLFKHDLLLRELLRATFGRTLKVEIISGMNDRIDSDSLNVSRDSVLLIDLTNVPTQIGYVLALVRVRLPKVGILALYREMQHFEICALLAKGVHGFLRYDLIRKDLSSALRAVAAGRLWVAKDVLERCVRQSWGRTDPASCRLTARECEIVRFVRQKFSNKEISERLKVSESTVKFHLGKVFRKLGLDDRRSLCVLPCSVTTRGWTEESISK
jgi:DNA-binding NarL/FixJ family response regulator